MDFLSHLSVPLTAAYVLRRDLFAAPWALAGFGLLADVDKFLGTPDLLRPLVTLVPICLALLLAEWIVRGDLDVAPVVALILSHLVLDFVGGGPVPLLFSFVETGIRLQYPARMVFGAGPVGLTLQGPLVTLRTSVPRGGFNTYGFIQGVGVASALLFATVYVGDRVRARQDDH